MLYTVNIGSPSGVDGPWEKITDEFGNNFLEKSDIRQRIRLDKNLDKIPSVEKAEVIGSFYRGYRLPSAVEWVNNTKNMNPMLHKVSKRKSHEKVDVIYIIVASTTYQILNYRASNILQTFHSRGNYQGCAIIPENKEDRILKLTVKELKTRKFYQIELFFKEDDPSLLEMKKTLITDAHEVAEYRKIAGKYKEATLGFKIYSDKLLTSTYLVSSERVEEMEKIVSDAKMKNANVVEVDKDTLENAEKLRELLTEVITEQRIRSVTLCEVELPLSLCNEFKLLYVFNYRFNTGEIVCKKSN